MSMSVLRMYGGVREGLPTLHTYNVLYKGSSCGEVGASVQGGGGGGFKNKRADNFT